ncbi:unnamed protein product [Heligmosomoides polygyrus]|uniref:7TM_GPCR_Srx domain-containing protein n=1 Tax=Heligmosomoides polygyrus TaxID=6339 RepID=A0A183FKA0_HELPZ|nr:unnamed protein product [Heligmosomoides polygyrus]
MGGDNRIPGIGFGIILLTVLNQHVMLHNGYYVLSHTMSLPGNIMDVVDCNSTYYTHSRRYLFKKWFMYKNE